MNNETEQIFILNPSDNQSTSEQQRLAEVPGTTQDSLENVENCSNVCRTCATITEFVIPIFDGEGRQNNLADKIHKHLPIQVSEQDMLPQVVCYQCASTLLAWHELVQCCVQADAALRTRLPLLEHTKPEESKPINIEPGQSTENEQQNKSDTTLIFHNNVKSVIEDFFPTQNVESDNFDVEFVCQLCSNKPNLTNLEKLTDHLQSEHYEATKNGVGRFIQEYITFEEILALEDSDRACESEGIEKPESALLFFCPFCECVFSSSTRLICHLNIHIEVSIDDGVMCCDVNYNDKKTFVQHLQTDHLRRVIDDNICRTCGYTTEDVDNLQKHINETHERKAKTSKMIKKKTANNQKFIPSVCPECNKIFSNKYNMFAHLKSHDGRTVSYPCDKCNKSYCNKGNLVSHKKLVHEGILNFVCSNCGEAFPTRSARDIHARLHSGTKPYECEYCEKSYRAKNTLDRHMEIHLNIRKYECHICTKKFRKRTHLNYHLGTHKK